MTTPIIIPDDTANRLGFHGNDRFPVVGSGIMHGRPMVDVRDLVGLLLDMKSRQISEQKEDMCRGLAEVLMIYDEAIRRHFDG